MHPVVLDAVGYTLLLSGLITLAMLLREGRKHKRRSPFYILSTSDVLSSVATAVALLASHLEAGIKFSHHWQNESNGVEAASGWTIKDNGKHKLLIPRTGEPGREAVREVDSNVTLTCDAKDVLVQYGMLLAPLTNALVSLLTFAVQCNLNATCARRRCTMTSPSASDAPPGETELVEVAYQREGASEDRQELASPGSRAENASGNVLRKIARMFRFQATKEHDKKPAGFLVTGHWLLPLLVTATLCFAEYDDTNAVFRRTENAECMFQSNFPVTFRLLSAEDDPEIAVVPTTPGENHYPVSYQASWTKSNLSGVEVSRIVSQVQSIVRNMLGHVGNSTEGAHAADFLGASKPRNLTDYDTSNGNFTNVINRVVQGTDNTTVERVASVYNSSSSYEGTGTYFDEEPEVSTFHDASLKNTSEESGTPTALDSSSNATEVSLLLNNSGYEEETLSSSAEEEDATRGAVDIITSQDSAFISDNQIYAEILKRIQAASKYAVLKSHRNRSVDRSYGTKQPERGDLEDRIARIRPDVIEDLFLGKADRLDVDTEASHSFRMINECLLSSEFLKLHLLIFSFAIYFLPILLCCILQARGEHTCENALATLKARADLLSTLFGDTDAVKDTVDKAAHTEWLATSSGSISHQNSTFGSNKRLEAGDAQDSTIDTEIANKKHENCTGTPNADSMLEVSRAARICGVVKVSLILCVLLWSPIFLGTLLKVFSCVRAPQWLTDTAFLSAISFGIVRNFLNMYMIKIHELCNNDGAKENQVHPMG